jgi:hypothetical protein
MTGGNLGELVTTNFAIARALEMLFCGTKNTLEARGLLLSLLACSTADYNLF